MDENSPGDEDKREGAHTYVDEEGNRFTDSDINLLIQEGWELVEENEGEKILSKDGETRRFTVDETVSSGIDLDIESTEEIEVSDSLIDQVIGQERARKVIEKAAKQHRHVMMIGAPGTGKSMLAKAMTEILPKERMEDILVYPNKDDDNEPKIRAVPAGRGEKIVEAYKKEAKKKNRMKQFFLTLVVVVVLLYAVLLAGSPLLGIIAAAVLFLVFKYGVPDSESMAPNLLIDNSDSEKAPFEDATGAHAGALLGDVRHDPFQSGGMETPAHERVEAGAIQKSNQGVLFVDEINTLDVRSQQKLMTAIQEGEFSITGQSDKSSGAMVQTEPVPTDFVMVAAGNMDAIENMHPALRDRLKGYGYEVYMNDKVEDTEEMRNKYAQFVAQEVERDGQIPHFTKDAVEELILEARRRAGEKGKLTLQLRDLGGLVRVAGDIALTEGAERTNRDHVLRAKDRSQSIEQQFVGKQIEKKKKYGVAESKGDSIGRVNGLAVMGDDSGILLPIAAEVTPAHGEGEVIATGKLQEIAQEAVQNVSAIIKKLGGDDLSSKDIHIQFIQTYEGVDGDSASITVATAIISAISGVGIRQDVAMTGSVSVRGDVLPVGGVTHKIEAAVKSGMNTVIIPKANEKDVMIEEEYKDEIEIVTAEHLSEVLEVALEGDENWIASLSEELRSVTSEGFGSLGISRPTPK